ncbi:oxidoreductase [Paenisporosarcina cavernae]|uniref:Oxidoreductase n=1 Tax=Paenisporosarcina cavernae TaxID=2320858 RepID=A0A385YQJ6_9BACL|nr:oxidoreductase [Paenisporosarcina cavernae]AYC28751.1 oxidoreductase [Paenisporosarcina cavernae]
MKKKAALLVGATGLVGNEVLHLLCEREEYAAIHVLSRRELAFSHPKMDVLVKDFDAIEVEDVEIADDFFCCIGTTIKKAGSEDAFEEVDVTFPVKLASFAKKKGMQHMLVISAMGANAESPIFYNQMKGKLEQQLTELSISRLSIFRPSLLKGERDEFRLGETIGNKLLTGLRPFLLGPMKKYRAIEAKQVAIAMVSTALRANRKVVSVYTSDQLAKMSIPVKKEEAPIPREALFNWESRKEIFIEEERGEEDA